MGKQQEDPTLQVEEVIFFAGKGHEEPLGVWNKCDLIQTLRSSSFSGLCEQLNVEVSKKAGSWSNLHSRGRRQPCGEETETPWPRAHPGAVRGCR